MQHKAVLFDLDGTLLDTAPDLHKAAELVAIEFGKQPIPYKNVRELISFGSKRILAETLKLDLDCEQATIDKLFDRYIDLYLNTNFLGTKTFPGIDNLISYLDSSGISWGIVTNKITSLTEPLLKKINSLNNTGCVVCGDSLERAKPYPDPLNFAAQKLGTKPENCVYIGDAKTDVEAGKAAKMKTIACSFGYVPKSSNIQSWQADFIAENANELLPWLTKWLEHRD